MSDPLVSKTLGAFPLPFIPSFRTSISVLLFPHFSTFHMPVVLQCTCSTGMQGESSAFYYFKNRKGIVPDDGRPLVVTMPSHTAFLSYIP